MNRRRYLGVLGVLGTAGCLRLEASDDESTATTPGDGNTRTTSPAATGTQPTADATTGADNADTGTDDGPPSYPRGLDETEAKTWLADTHSNRLWDEPFAVTWLLENTTDGHLVKNDETRYGNGVGRRRSAAEIGTTFAFGDDGTFWRQVVDGQLTYGQHVDLATQQSLTHREHVRILLGQGAWTDVAVAEDENAFVVTADGVAETAPEEFSHYRLAGEATEEFTGEMHVRENGIVTSLEASYSARNATTGERQAWRAAFDVTEYGDTNTSIPTWYDTARERAPALSGTVVNDGLALEVTHDGGNPLLADSGALLYDADADAVAGWGAKTTSPFAAGDVLHVYHADGVQLAISRNGPPAPADVSDRLAGEYRFWFDHGEARYHPGVTVSA